MLRPLNLQGNLVSGKTRMTSKLNITQPAVSYPIIKKSDLIGKKLPN